MRVALLSHNARNGDAIGRQVAAKAAFFRDRGAFVRVFVESAHQLHPDLDPFVEIVDASTSLESIAADLRKCDLVSVEFGQHYRLAEVLPLLSGGRARIVFDYHGVTPPQFALGNCESLRAGQKWRALAWFADEAAVHSQFMQHELCSAIGLPIERTVVVPLWRNEAQAGSTPTGFLQSHVGVPDAQIALFVGRLAPNKRVPVLIEAIAGLKNEFPKLHAVIVGDDGGAYRSEAAKCRDLAEQLEVADRVHFLGTVSDSELAEAYRFSAVFVMPSVHEGFCIPAIEAMAHGVPVIGARATALPETLADAGLLFEPDDSADLAEQMRRVLTPSRRPDVQSQTRRVAFVAAGFGDQVLGGAERSLRTMAQALAAAGWEVEVFTLGQSEKCERDDGILIRRFIADPVDVAAMGQLQQHSHARHGCNAVALHHFERSNRSAKLLDSIIQRAGEFAAIITGPYGSGLAWHVAHVLAEKTILVPCFHDESLARSSAVRSTYRQVVGLVFHSPEERDLAQSELGISNPNATVAGAWLNPVASTPLPSSKRRYVLYSGRYCREKNVSLLIDWQRRYEAERPGRFTFAFTGSGDVPIPDSAPWLDHGFVPEGEHAPIIHGAALLVQLSCNESLSLAALEAWQHGVPVMAHRDCKVLAGMIARSKGGACVADYEDFRACLDDLFEQPQRWRQFGMQGRVLVRDEFECRDSFTQRLVGVLGQVGTPLVHKLRTRALERAGRFDARAWEDGFAVHIERVLHQEPAPRVEMADVRPRAGRSSFSSRSTCRKLPIEIENLGTVPILSQERAPAVLWSIVRTLGGEPATPATATRLRDILLPGRPTTLLARVHLPDRPGEYRVAFALRTDGEPTAPRDQWKSDYPLIIEADTTSTPHDSMIEQVRTLLAEAERIQDLPDGYTDVTTGTLAKWKQSLKQKLLHQFKTAYVDVLSRQQSDWNRHVVSILHELAECVGILEHSVVEGPTGEPTTELARLVTRLQRGAKAAAERIESLEERLQRLEALVQQSPARTQE